MFDLVWSFAAAIDEFEDEAVKVKQPRRLSTVPNRTNGGFGAGVRFGERAGTVGDSVQSLQIGMGTNVIFMRDSQGNTVFHLCVYHGLMKMYDHVYATVEALIARELKMYHQKQVSEDLDVPSNKYEEIFDLDCDRYLFHVYYHSSAAFPGKYLFLGIVIKT